MSESHTSLIDTLKDRGYRLTRQRRILLEVLESAGDHVRAKDLLRLGRVQDPRIDRATVYRTLSVLKEEGLIDELDLMHLEGEDHYYERRTRQDHVHIGCVHCGNIVEMESELVSKLKEEMRATTGFDVVSVRIEAIAVCPRCRQT